MSCATCLLGGEPPERFEASGGDWIEAFEADDGQPRIGKLHSSSSSSTSSPSHDDRQKESDFDRADRAEARAAGIHLVIAATLDRRHHGPDQGEPSLARDFQACGYIDSGDPRPRAPSASSVRGHALRAAWHFNSYYGAFVNDDEISKIWRSSAGKTHLPR